MAIASLTPLRDQLPFHVGEGERAQRDRVREAANRNDRDRRHKRQSDDDSISPDDQRGTIVEIVV
jgi:hypothetical protein